MRRSPRCVRVKTSGGRFAREAMLARRVAQEYSSRPSPSSSSSSIEMGFGKFRGVPVSAVDGAYLRWCVDNLDKCPSYVIDEVKRRKAAVKPTAVKPKNALSSQQFADSQRQAAAKHLATLQAGVVTVGSDYERLRLECDRADCDWDACPFDCEDYVYSGPTMVPSSGRVVIVEPEFTVRIEQPS
jgi:hypothetical protein